VKSEPFFMKTIYTLFLFIVCTHIAAAQSNEDYYNPVTTPIKPFFDPVEPKANNFKKRKTEALLAKYGNVKIRNRWYIGTDGFIGTDKNSISNTFQGLVDTRTAGKSGYGASLGWVNQEKWTVEFEYARMPIFNRLIISGYNPLEYKLSNDKNSLAMRVKRRLLFGKSNSSVRRSAFWIGAGAGIVPNSGKQKEYLEFEGYASSGPYSAPDTLVMTSDTRTNTKMTAFADVSAEYIIKVAKGIDLSIYGRKRWGFGSSVTTDLAYYVNKTQTQSSVIKSDGSGLIFGISLRYVFSMGYDFDDEHNAK
jgi:hypothetical protein